MGRSAGKHTLRANLRRYRGLLRPCWSLLERLLVGMTAHVRLCEKLLWGMAEHAHLRSGERLPPRSY
jgi:hypothetical protein